MLYDFVCDECGVCATVRASISTGPTPPICHALYSTVADFPGDTRPVTMAEHGPMRRLYGSQPAAIVQLDMADYIEKAYRGEEPAAGLTTRQVRAIVDQQVTTNHRGRKNHARRR